MKRMWLPIMAAFALLHCKSMRTENELMDAFLESPLDGKHQVVYLEEGQVYRVFCGEEHRFSNATLTRQECSYKDPRLQFEKLDYEREYKPKLASYLELHNPETIKGEIEYLKATLEKIAQRHIEEGLKNVDVAAYRTGFEEEILTIENRLSLVEPQLARATLFEAIVGSPDGQKPGILDVTEKFKDFAVSIPSMVILAPFGSGGVSDAGIGGVGSGSGKVADAGYSTRPGGSLDVSHAGVRFSFALIKNGSFQMGSPVGEGDIDEKLHRVTISQDFLLQTTEVTRGQYRAVMGRYPEEDLTNSCGPVFKDDGHPVSCVSWADARRFIDRLNSQTAGRPYRLPTEAEWEFATRCGTSGPYSQDGVQVNEASLKAAKIAWFAGNSPGKRTNPVGLLKPNPCGLYDVHGNVWELVEDIYLHSFPAEEVDPEGRSTSTTDRVIRGGSWFDLAQNCRSADRLVFPEMGRGSNIGFRLLREIPVVAGH